MDAAKNAVKDFMAKSGHHDTTVHEKVAPGVVHETINRERHENVQTAIDKEVHQDHYHTSVQPVHDREVLPETHHHNLGAVEHRQFEHGNDREVAERLKVEAAQFHDKTIEGTERHTQSVAPTLQGEHIHHHVHETIQPIVQKETIEPHVTHTTVPIHEVHHNAAQHHTASALPAVSMSEFNKQGGVLTGREERYDGFEGEPRSVGGHSTGAESAILGSTGATGHHTGHHHGHHASGTTGTSGLTGTGHNTTGTSGLTGTGHNTTGTSGLSGTGRDYETTGRDYETTGRNTTGTTGLGAGTAGVGSTGHHNSSSTTGTKPSLMDKVNPKKDTDGDGKAGFMD